MNKFSEAYGAARSALQNGELAGDFKDRKQALSRVVAGASGPSVAESAHLEELRKALEAEAQKLASGNGEDRGEARAIVAGAGAPVGLNERAATLKMLRHLYHEKSSGGQQIWVYSPPEAYAKWLFDEVSGANATTLEDCLAKPNKEVYSKAQRAVMATAVQEARAVALTVVAKLGSPGDATKSLVRQYFGDASTTSEQLDKTMATLAGGYQKIAAACNDGNIIISDEPIDRNGGGWKDWAFIYSTEAMSVVYLQGAWLKKADEITSTNQNPLYRCVRTVIHELSHKQVGTEDVVYGPKGLKPEGSASLTAAYALHNADSWAYFAVDLMGYLVGPDKANGEKATTSILKTPTRTLTV